MSKQLLTRSEVAQRLGVSERTAQRMTSSGLLRPVRLGRLVRFHVDDIERLAAGGCGSWARRSPSPKVRERRGVSS
jgi:excisionase family DNA binding protein